MKKKKIIVIGSGISGLTAAALLARHGHDVIILDKKSKPGGALKRFRRQEIAFDVGFHYTGGLGSGEILTTLWKYCGIYDHLQVIPFPKNSAECVHFPDSKTCIKAEFSYQGLTEKLSEHFPAEREGISHFFQLIEEKSRQIPFYSFSGPLEPFLQSLAFPEKTSLGDVIRSCTDNPRLQAILALPVFLHGVPPDEIGITLHATVAHLVYSGMYWISGGGQGIVDGFVKTFKNRVELRTGVHIKKIITRENCVTGVRTTDDEISATDVIFTGHPADIFPLVPSGVFRKAYVNRLHDLRNTGSMFIVFGSLNNSERYRDLIWNNQYQIPAELDILQVKRKQPEQKFFLSSCGFRDVQYKEHTKKNAVVLIRPASWEETQRFDQGPKSKRAAGYRQWKNESAQKLLTAAGKICPGIDDDFQVAAIGSPLTFRDELDYPFGAVYGVQRSLDQFPVGARTRLPGLWLSGQSTMMPGIIGASMAALVTVGEILDLEPLWQEIKQW